MEALPYFRDLSDYKLLCYLIDIITTSFLNAVHSSFSLIEVIYKILVSTQIVFNLVTIYAAYCSAYVIRKGFVFLPPLQ